MNKPIKKRNHPRQIQHEGEILVSVSEIAKRLNLTEYYVRELAKQGKIPAHKIGLRWWFRLSDAVDGYARHLGYVRIPIQQKIIVADYGLLAGL